MSPSSIGDLRTLDTFRIFTGFQWSHHVICLKNHRMSLRSTLLQWKPAHVYISGNRHSQWFRLSLPQIISGLKAVTFYVHGSRLRGLCTDPLFLDFIYIGLYYLCFSLGHQNPPLSRKLSVNYNWFSKEIWFPSSQAREWQKTAFISQSLHLLWLLHPRDPNWATTFSSKSKL